MSASKQIFIIFTLLSASFTWCSTEERVSASAIVEFFNEQRNQAIRARVAKDIREFYNGFLNLVVEAGWAPNLYLARRCSITHDGEQVTSANIIDSLTRAEEHRTQFVVHCPTGTDRRDKGYNLLDLRSPGKLFRIPIPEFMGTVGSGGAVAVAFLSTTAQEKGFPLEADDTFIYHDSDNSIKLLSRATREDLERFYQGNADIRLISWGTLPERYALSPEAIEALQRGESIRIE